MVCSDIVCMGMEQKAHMFITDWSLLALGKEHQKDVSLTSKVISFDIILHSTECLKDVYMHPIKTP